MSNTTKNSDGGPEDNAKQFHTYTPRSHEELLKKFSRSTVKNDDVKDIKRENDYLKSELNTSRKQIKRLQKTITHLESKKKRDVKGISSSLYSVPESRSNITSEIDLNNDDDYIKSWEVLGHHFSEVIRRHHDILAEKDRQIRQLQENQYSKEISNRLYNHYSTNNTLQMNENKTSGSLNDKSPTDRSAALGKVNTEYYEIGLPGRSDPDSSINYQCSDQCNCAELSIPGEDKLIYSGEILSEHFSEVIRRHKQQLLEKNQQIQELEEALESCLGQKPPRKRKDDSEVQMWYHDYHHDQSQSSVRAGHPTAGSAVPMRSSNKVRNAHLVKATTRSKANYSDGWDSSADEDEDSLDGSTDTFVALEKCQRLESIANLERLRQNLIQRLELEEKLDKLYWQTEMNRYRALREEAGDNFDPDCSFNKDFEMLEATRLELLRALKEVKDSAEREPEMYVQPHFPIQDSVSIVRPQTQFLESESKRRVQFTEEITITTVKTTFDQ